mmetsp:Transcript_7089/g.12724  ORF Transcript_7089/g.12724 Transcript_7089/m.12724 type:complete len:294 (+) Transcript_7089:720-1601(+)
MHAMQMIHSRPWHESCGLPLPFDPTNNWKMPYYLFPPFHPAGVPYYYHPLHGYWTIVFVGCECECTLRYRVIFPQWQWNRERADGLGSRQSAPQLGPRATIFHPESVDNRQFGGGFQSLPYVLGPCAFPHSLNNPHVPPDQTDLMDHRASCSSHPANTNVPHNTFVCCHDSFYLVPTEVTVKWIQTCVYTLADEHSIHWTFLAIHSKAHAIKVTFPTPRGTRLLFLYLRLRHRRRTVVCRCHLRLDSHKRYSEAIVPEPFVPVREPLPLAKISPSFSSSPRNICSDVFGDGHG